MNYVLGGLNMAFGLIIKANEMHYFSDLFDKVLYIFSDKFTVHHQE
jgi:hypothetical protein